MRGLSDEMLFSSAAFCCGSSSAVSFQNPFLEDRKLLEKAFHVIIVVAKPFLKFKLKEPAQRRFLFPRIEWQNVTAVGAMVRTCDDPDAFAKRSPFSESEL